MEETMNFAVCGNLVHATNDAECVVLQNKCIGVKEGKIVFIDDASNLSMRLSEHSIPVTSVEQLHGRQFVIPGLVDTHVHAPQYPNAGKGLDRGLLEWLETYTFPTEAKFKDLMFAEETYTRAITRILRNGTTTACYFATIDADATLLLCDVIDQLGQRAYVGKVNMNQNSPAYYIESSAEQSVSETKRYIDEVLLRQYKRITPIVTPRFAISCCEDLMKQLGQLAKDYNLPIQTHICETKDEVSLVAQLFPNSTHYTHVYDMNGLLTEKTVLAHGIYLTQPEIELIKLRNAAISHCPNSNLSIRSGMLDVRHLMKHNVKVGLGTDLSGGYHPSILDAIRTALHVSNSLSLTKENGYKPITVREAFRLATLGGAKALSLEHMIGNFEVGKEFDALVIDPGAKGSVMDMFNEDSIEDCLDKFLLTGDDRNIETIFVGGRRVHLKMCNHCGI